MERNPHHHARKILCRLLREAREAAGLRQVDVATKLAKPQSFVSKYEQGERRLDFVELREVCLVVGLSVSELAQQFEQALPRRRK